MDFKNKSAVILLSGGLDSSTVTGLAKASKAKIFGLSFDYGQRHKKELNSALTIAKHFEIEEFKIVKLDLSLWGGSSLTDTKKDFAQLDKQYYLQPAWKNDNGFSLTIDFVKNNPEWNLSLQTHKYLRIK